MKGTEHFKKAIKAYLDERAGSDALFAASYAKEGKNLEDCITYIINQVKASGCCGWERNEIFGLAVDYYDEDNIKVGERIDCTIVVPNHIELTEEEKKEARQNAILAYQNEELSRLRSHYSKPKPSAKQDTRTQSLFDL